MEIVVWAMMALMIAATAYETYRQIRREKAEAKQPTEER
jgi:hypothetical protein